MRALLSGRRRAAAVGRRSTRHIPHELHLRWSHVRSFTFHISHLTPRLQPRLKLSRQARCYTPSPPSHTEGPTLHRKREQGASASIHPPTPFSPLPSPHHRQPRPHPRRLERPIKQEPAQHGRPRDRGLPHPGEPGLQREREREGKGGRERQRRRVSARAQRVLAWSEKKKDSCAFPPFCPRTHTHTHTHPVHRLVAQAQLYGQRAQGPGEGAGLSVWECVNGKGESQARGCDERSAA